MIQMQIMDETQQSLMSISLSHSILVVQHQTALSLRLVENFLTASVLLPPSLAVPRENHLRLHTRHRLLVFGLHVGENSVFSRRHLSWNIDFLADLHESFFDRTFDVDPAQVALVRPHSADIVAMCCTKSSGLSRAAIANVFLPVLLEPE